MPITGTPLDLLTTSNPLLDKTRQKEGDVTKSEYYTKLIGDNFEQWTDFNYENILHAFGDFLTSGIVEADVTSQRQGSPFEIRSERSVYRIMDKWNLDICRNVLKSGAREIQGRLGLPPTDITLQVQEKDLSVSGANKPLEPDFAIFLRDSTETILVWGENKLSTTWKSDKEALPLAWKGNWIWPFRQLAYYLVGSNTRYGCLLTPDELVVVRLYAVSSRGDVKHNLQWTSIPWESAGNEQLTINFGLWAIAMMALNEEHRAIANESEVLPLNVWWKAKDETGNDVYKHHLTGVVVDRLPPHAIARDRPPPVVKEPTPDEVAARTSKRLRRG